MYGALWRVLPGPVWLRVTVRTGGKCHFSFSLEGERFASAGEPFTATCGHWVGAKFGLFAATRAGTPSAGHAGFSSFRVQPPSS